MTKFYWLLLAALLLRLIIAPFTFHPWEYRTYANTANDLHHGVNPYTHFLELSEETQSKYEGQFAFYEYWAYPPTGLAWLYLVGFAEPEPVPYYADLNETIPEPLIAFLFKLPAIAGDFLIAWLLYLISRRRSLALWWLFMPMPFFVSAVWGGADSITIAFVLAAVWFYQRYRLTMAGAMLGLGLATKIFPVFVVPVFWRYVSNYWRFVLAIGGVMLAASAYYLITSPFDYAQVLAGFHGSRPGAGLTLWNIWQLGTMTDFWVFVFRWVWFIPLSGLWLWLWFRVRRPLIPMIALTLLAFLLTSKLVQAVYPLWALPLLLLCYKSKMQLIIWQLVAIVFVFVNYGSLLSFATWPAEKLGLAVELLPLDDRYMLYLGVGWLFWGLTFVIFRDLLKKTT